MIYPYVLNITIAMMSTSPFPLAGEDVTNLQLPVAGAVLED